MGPVLFPSQNEIVYGGDLLTQFYYWKGFLAQNLREGQIPFWNPYNFSGTPFLAHPGTAVFYPATLLYLLFPLNIAFSINYFIHLVIGGMGMFFLCRKYSSALISLFSAVIFMYSGYFSTRIYAGHVDLMTTAVWIPWVIYFIFSVTANPDKRKYIIKAIISLTLLIFAGYSAYLVFILELFFLFFIWLLFIRSQNIGRIFVSFSLIIVASLMVASVQWLPTWQLTRNSIRGGGLPYSLASWGSLPVSGLRLFMDPLNRNELNKISFNLGGGPRDNPFDHFTGGLPLILVILYLFYELLIFLTNAGKKRIKISRDFWFYLIVSLLFVWISFGPFITPNLHYWLYTVLPPYRYIRIPIQNLVIPVVLVPVILAMILSKIKLRALQVTIGFLIIAELFIFSRQFIFLTDIPEQKHDRSMINKINKNPTKGRVLLGFRVISPLLNRFDMNSSMLYRFESTSGYDPVILKSYYDFIDSGAGNNSSSLPFYNVEIPPVAPDKDVIRRLNVSQVVNDDGKVTENKNFLPRFYYSGNDSCIDENKNIKIVEYSLNKVILNSTNECGSVLYSSEVYYPGWRANIDGKNIQVIKSYSPFRTINLPKGSHTIEYYYYPEIYFQGFLISITGIFITIFAVRKYYV